ncbi:SMI1/KNR4 family protein [Streptacidiphilus anmyonensis]|uniref:SMI1/KNR4 family protein n=1 Tax=Streptacidiphilus anmyonensis TaxID=405782 RepID=UPI0005AA47BE|nr:SMI1/KNR4 family protein [Streptacidiphilus anmyonensis]
MDEQMWAGVRDFLVAKGCAVDDLLSTNDLAELETQIGVRLPEEYRQFLLCVGAGAEGPGCEPYGVHPVRKLDGRWRWMGTDGDDPEDWPRLSEPFPGTGLDPARLSALQEAEPDEEKFDDSDDFDEAWQEWHEEWNDFVWSPDQTVGAIRLNEQGCGGFQWLVVSGPERGTIWGDDRGLGAPGLGPLGMTFAAWYMEWLTWRRRMPRKR